MLKFKKLFLPLNIALVATLGFSSCTKKDSAPADGMSGNTDTGTTTGPAEGGSTGTGGATSGATGTGTGAGGEAASGTTGSPHSMNDQGQNRPQGSAATGAPTGGTGTASDAANTDENASDTTTGGNAR